MYRALQGVWSLLKVTPSRRVITDVLPHQQPAVKGSCWCRGHSLSRISPAGGSNRRYPIGITSCEGDWFRKLRSQTYFHILGKDELGSNTYPSHWSSPHWSSFPSFSYLGKDHLWWSIHWGAMETFCKTFCRIVFCWSYGKTHGKNRWRDSFPSSRITSWQSFSTKTLHRWNRC